MTEVEERVDNGVRVDQAGFPDVRAVAVSVEHAVDDDPPHFVRKHGGEVLAQDRAVALQNNASVLGSRPFKTERIAYEAPILQLLLPEFLGNLEHISRDEVGAREPRYTPFTADLLLATCSDDGPHTLMESSTSSKVHSPSSLVSKVKILVLSA